MNTDPRHDWRTVAWIAFLLTLLALSLVVLNAKPAHAAPIEQSVVMVGGCSGVCVDPSGLVLTVKHCGLPDVTQVKFRDRSVIARKLYETPECDGPVIFDCEGEGYPWVPIAQLPPPAGSDVWSSGYPARNGSRQIVMGWGKVLGSARWKHKVFDCGALVNEVSIVCGEGWSGGPLFTQSNEVCGLCLGGDKRTTFFCSFSSIRAAMDSVRQQVPSKPTLYVFTSRSCQPCTQFKNDYAGNVPFKTAINAAYTVQFVDIDQQPQEATRRGVRDVPAFVRDNHANIVGYETPDKLLTQLGLKEQEAVIERPATPITPAQPPAQPATPPVAPPVPITTPPIVQRLDWLSQVAHIGFNVASVVMAGTATGGTAWAAWAGLSLLRRVLGRRQPVATQQPSMHLPPATQPMPQPAPVIPTETPPPPQVVIPTTQYAPYEVDSFAQAFAWAGGEYVRKYPGAVGTVEGIKSLITQYLAAKGIKVK